MGDRAPLLFVGLFALVAALGWFLVRGAHRGAFAEPWSTYRSEPDGARGLYLVLSEQHLNVTRRLESLDSDELGSTPDSPPESLILLGVRFAGEGEATPVEVDGSDGGDRADGGSGPAELDLWHGPPVDSDERHRLLELARRGATVVVAPARARPNPFLDELGASLVPASGHLGLRTLVPAQPSRFTKGVEHLEAPVIGFLQLPPGAVPLLVDTELDEVVAAVVPVERGRVIVLGAPGLAENRHLAKGDNARFWSSLVSALATTGPVAFDEFHHGFKGERSVGAFAGRYRLQYAVGQLLLGLSLWALSLRRFGRPHAAQSLAAGEHRVGSLDLLRSTGRLYREGRHHAHAASAIAKGLEADLAKVAGVGPAESVEAISRALVHRGRPELARALATVTLAAEGAKNDADLRSVGRLAALARLKLHPASRTP